MMMTQSRMNKLIISNSNARDKADSLGWELKRLGFLTDHPGDEHLFVTLCYNKSKDEYIVHLYNSSDNAFHEGFYTRNFEVASEKFDFKR